MLQKIKRTKIFKKIKPPFIYLYNKLYDYNIKSELLILKDKVRNLFRKTPNIMTLEESINYIIENKSSVSRFGDGELKLIIGLDVYFQPYTKDIGQRIKYVLESNEKNHIVGIPDVFGSLKKYRKKHRKFWEKHLSLYRDNWYKYLKNNKLYLNAFISRPYMIYKDRTNCKYYFDTIKQLWNQREVVIIEGCESRLGVGNDLFDNSQSIHRILCPRVDAYKYYDDILLQAKKIDKNKLILLAIGPTATILAYDLYKLGYQAIDIGHIDIEYEWFLRNVEDKVAIKNKYVGEAIGGDVVQDEYNEKYRNQIIYEIV